MLITNEKKEYYIIKGQDNTYLIQHTYNDIFYFSKNWEKAIHFSSRQKAIDFMRIEKIKGIVFKVFYKELVSL